jgi:hypothetical protein
MFMIEYKDAGWWYWLITAALLTFGVFGNHAGFVLAIGFTAFQLFHFVIREGGITRFPVQVRFWYLSLLMIGTWAQVIFGYCTMARLVSLFPRNRATPFSLALVKKTFLSRPVRGSIQQEFAAPREVAENA